MKNVKEKLNSEFKMKDLGEANSFLGLNLERNQKYLSINQRKYISDLLKKYNIEYCKPIRNEKCSIHGVDWKSIVFGKCF